MWRPMSSVYVQHHVDGSMRRVQRALNSGHSLPASPHLILYNAQDYGKFGVVDMDDKQKLFRLMKRLNAEPQSLASGSDRSAAQQQQLAAGQARRGSRSQRSMSTLEARLRAQMLDGNAALLSLADDGEEEELLMQVCMHAADILGSTCDSLVCGSAHVTRGPS